MKTENDTNRWLTLRLGGDRFAINIHNVRELVPLRDVLMTRPPQMPEGMAGVAQVRNMTIGVLDLRTLLGMPPMSVANNQVIEMLDERKRDHILWLNELELSANEEREFKLAIDPHQCAFGRWYDELMNDRQRLSEFTNDDLTLLEVIERFDAPHQRIHGIAEQVAKLVKQNCGEEARQLIQATRDTDLRLMIELFDRCRSTFCELRKGLMIIVDCNSEVIGAMVDSVDEVAKFSTEQIDPVPPIINDERRLIQGLARTSEGGQLIQLLNVDAFADQTQSESEVPVSR